MDGAETIKIKNCLKSWHFSIDSKILLSALSGNEKLLYITLCSYLSPSGDTCFPSVKRLTLQMSCSRATIFRTLLELGEKNIVIRHEQFGNDGRRITTLYEVHDIPEEFYIRANENGNVEQAGELNENPLPISELQAEPVGSQIETGGCLKTRRGVSQFETQSFTNRTYTRRNKR